MDTTNPMMLLAQNAGLKLQENGELAVTMGELGATHIYPALLKHNFPEPLARELALNEVWTARAMATQGFLTARLIDMTAARLEIEIYKAERRAMRRTEQEVEADVVLATASGVLQPVPTMIVPPTPSNPTTGHLVATIAAEGRSGGTGTRVTARMPVKFNSSGQLLAATQADDAIGIVTAVNGGSARVALLGEKVTGYTGLSHGAYYYCGPAGTLIRWAAIDASLGYFKAIARALSTDTVLVIDRPLTAYDPALPLD